MSPTKPDSLLEGCTLDAALRRGEGVNDDTLLSGGLTASGHFLNER